MSHKYKYQRTELKITYFHIMLFYLLLLRMCMYMCEMCTHIWMYMGTHMYGCTVCIHAHGDQRCIKKCLSRWLHTLFIEVGSVSEP